MADVDATPAGNVVEVIFIGCGRPNFSMGWTHLEQMLREPLASLAAVVGVVEPYYLSEACVPGEDAELFREYVAAHKDLRFVPSCTALAKELPAVAPGRVRAAIISTRTPDVLPAFQGAVLELGCRAVYLEKPGAATVAHLDDIAQLAEKHQVDVVVGYNRNVSLHVRRALAFAKEREADKGTPPSVTLLHGNPFCDKEMNEVFRRCRPGLFYDMACHELAIAVGFFGLTAAGYSELRVDKASSLQAVHGGITDFVRAAFSLRPAPGAEPIGFQIDRQAGSFNGIDVDGRRFLSGEPPLLYTNPLQSLSSHIALNYDQYVEAKRIFLSALAPVNARAAMPAAAPAAAPRVAPTAPAPSISTPADADTALAATTAPLPAGLMTLKDAREVLLLAGRLTEELGADVPCAADGARAGPAAKRQRVADKL